MRRNRLMTRFIIAAALSAVWGAVAVAQTPTTAAAAFGVGNGPEGVVSDGANVWVANQFSETVTKLSGDGAALGTYAVGRRPLALAFDGNFVWVANYLSDNVMKLDPSSGAVVGTYAVGDGPGGLLAAGDSR